MSDYYNPFNESPDEIRRQAVRNPRRVIAPTFAGASKEGYSVAYDIVFNTELGVDDMRKSNGRRYVLKDEIKMATLAPLDGYAVAFRTRNSKTYFLGYYIESERMFEYFKSKQRCKQEYVMGWTYLPKEVLKNHEMPLHKLGA